MMMVMMKSMVSWIFPWKDQVKARLKKIHDIYIVDD